MMDQLPTLVDAAIMRWAIADISDLDRELLHGVEWPVADPGDHLLSLIDGARITIDNDAPAFDYYIDRALRDEEVFSGFCALYGPDWTEGILLPLTGALSN